MCHIVFESNISILHSPHFLGEKEWVTLNILILPPVVPLNVPPVPLHAPLQSFRMTHVSQRHYTIIASHHPPHCFG